MDNIRVCRYAINKLNDQNIYVVDNLISLNEILWLYHKLISSDGWNLSRRSHDEGIIMNQFGSFPGLKVLDENIIYNHFFSGYFYSVFFRLKSAIFDTHNLKLPNKIKRIFVAAKNSSTSTSLHKDSNNKGDFSVVGCLNPRWNNNDGGELFIHENKIDFKTGRFIIFPSDLMHNGGEKISQEISYWRLSVNFILSEN